MVAQDCPIRRIVCDGCENLTSLGCCLKAQQTSIQFGAKDSELIECTYHIPEGMEAVIDGDKVIIRKKETEDEKIRKELLELFNDMEWDDSILHDYNLDKNKTIAWLEKQGEQIEINPTEFDIRLQSLIGQFDSLPKEELIGSLNFWLNVVRNDGTYKEEKQDEQKDCKTCGFRTLACEQKPTDKIEPKFKVGEWITIKE